MSEQRDEFEQRFAQRYSEYLGDAPGTMDTKKVMAAVTREVPGRPGWVRIATLGAATITAAAVITLVTLGVLPRIDGPVGTSSASPQASGSPSATPASTPTATPPQPVAVPWPTLAPSEASVPSSLDGQDFAFWTLYRPPPCCGNLLRVAMSSGSSDRTIDVPDFSSPDFEPMPAGPAGGRVVYVVSDGRTAHLRVADARTGTDTELTSTNLVIGLVAIDPEGLTAYYLLFDRQDSAFQGLWAISTRGGQPSPLVSAQATTEVATLAASRVYVTPQLAVSEDGSWIAYVICHTIDCEFHAIHSDGTAEPTDWSNFHAGDGIVGIAGDLLIGSSECAQPNCDGFVLDLRTGERWPLGGADAPFAPSELVAGPHGPLVLGERADYDHGQWRVEALDLTDGSRSTAFEGTFQPGTDELHLAQASSLGYQAGAELPAGWFLVYRFGIADGLALPAAYSAVISGAALETRLPFMDAGGG